MTDFVVWKKRGWFRRYPGDFALFTGFDWNTFNWLNLQKFCHIRSTFDDALWFLFCSLPEFVWTKLLYISHIPKVNLPGLALPCLKTFCVAARCRKGGEAKACPLIGETSKANTCDRSPMTIHTKRETNKQKYRKTHKQTGNQKYRQTGIQKKAYKQTRV